MCKAGFAGDDAPRAVFRELLHTRLSLTKCLPVAIASIVGRPRHLGQVSLKSTSYYSEANLIP